MEYVIKLIMVIALVVFAMDIVSAQENRQDAVYLENGSMVRGVIIENIPESHVKIQTVDGSIWVFESDRISRVDVVDKYKPSNPVILSPRGFYNVTDIGFLPGRNNYSGVFTVSAQTSCGYRINPNISLGAGVGLENFEVALAPLFGEARFNLLKGSFSPFLAVKGGYALPMNNYKDANDDWMYKGGPMFSSAIGIRNYFSSHMGMTVSLGYRYQQSSFTQYYWWFSEGDKSIVHNYYNRFVFRIGFLFS